MLKGFAKRTFITSLVMKGANWRFKGKKKKEKREEIKSVNHNEHNWYMTKIATDERDTFSLIKISKDISKYHKSKESKHHVSFLVTFIDALVRYNSNQSTNKTHHVPSQYFPRSYERKLPLRHFNVRKTLDIGVEARG